MSSFEFRSLPTDTGRARVFLLQLPGRTDHLPPVEQPVTIARLDGTGAQQAIMAFGGPLGLDTAGIDTFLKDGGSRAASEGVAQRVLLTAAVVTGMRSADKVRQVTDGVASLSDAELGIWVARALHDEDAARSDNARKALVVMCTGTL